MLRLNNRSGPTYVLKWCHTYEIIMMVLILWKNTLTTNIVKLNTLQPIAYLQ